MPPAEPRGEIGDVVRGDGAIAQLAVDAHLAQEILVAGPRIADERNVGDVDVRTGRDDGGILEAQRTVGQVETPREMVEHEAAALTCRHGLDGGVDRLPVDGEVADTRRDAVEVHVAEVDAEFGVAPREPLQAEQKDLIYSQHRRNRIVCGGVFNVFNMAKSHCMYLYFYSCAEK